MYLAGGVCPKKYVPQVQGEIWVTGALWGDFMSYHPGLPPFLIRVEPDPKYQSALDEHMPSFYRRCLPAVSGCASLALCRPQRSKWKSRSAAVF